MQNMCGRFYKSIVAYSIFWGIIYLGFLLEIIFAYICSNSL